jgi:hypothetical protein
MLCQFKSIMDSIQGDIALGWKCEMDGFFFLSSEVTESVLYKRFKERVSVYLMPLRVSLR